VGFLGFLKPKKRGKSEDFLAPAPEHKGYAQLPPLPSGEDVYSDLPSLPEAPDVPGLSEMNANGSGMESEGLDLPESSSGMGLKDWGPESSSDTEQEGFPELPKMPSVPEDDDKKPNFSLPELPRPKEDSDIPDKIPELNHFAPENRYDSSKLRGHGRVITQNDGFYLISHDFKMIVGNINSAIKLHKRHHKLSVIKKEDNKKYEELGSIAEDLERNLMRIDRELFEES
jgi:hypothetical protein